LGAWELVPVHKLELVDANSKDDFVRVGQLVELYEPSRVALRRPGAVVGPARGKIGDTVDRSLMKPLRRAVLAAALELNPVHAIPPEEPSSDTDEEDGRDSDASGVYTSDAATLWGHTFSGGEYVSVEYGSMVRALELTELGWWMAIFTERPSSGSSVKSDICGLVKQCSGKRPSRSQSTQAVPNPSSTL
jgi:hypothetical protein